MRRRFWWRLLGCVILIYLVVLGGSLIAVRGTFAKRRPVALAGGSAVVVGAAGHRIAGRVYLTGPAVAGAPLVVVLHGDAPFVNPGYQYRFASDLADAVPGTRVVGLLRPGYADPYGAKSDGDRGFASGENYTDGVDRDVAVAIEALKQDWSARDVILVGHSGGAAIAANVAATSPGLVQHVVLVGCPCDVPAFRRHMARMQWGPMWLLPVRSLSPMEVEEIQQRTTVTAISGSDDPIALPKYAEAYIAKVKAHGIAASMILMPGKGHEILNEGAVVGAVAQAVREDLRPG